MEKIKYYIPYLGHGVKIYEYRKDLIDLKDKYFFIGKMSLNADYTNPKNFSDGYMLALRPLSDLDKPIISGGLRLTPLYWWNEDYDATDKFNQMINLQKQRDFYLNYTSYEVLERLLCWHFDLFGLIEKGLAVDINTIK